METINSFPIIATWNTPTRGCERAGRIIVVDRGREHTERYVVAWQATSDGGWAREWDESGYCRDLGAAAASFQRRIDRELERR